MNRGGLQGLYQILLEDSGPWFAAALRHISSESHGHAWLTLQGNKDQQLAAVLADLGVERCMQAQHDAAAHLPHPMLQPASKPASQGQPGWQYVCQLSSLPLPP